MIEKPILIKNLFSGERLAYLQQQVLELKKSPDLKLDDHTYHRHHISDPLEFKRIHFLEIMEIARHHFEEELYPSYCFLSFYLEGKGRCPAHFDRPQCYRTVDVCLNQRAKWALHVSPVFEQNPPLGQFEVTPEMRRTAIAYYLEPGDALLYSGVHQYHWRDQIAEDNFCDLVFFHFVKGSAESYC
jgi:hypothetical protein